MREKKKKNSPAESENKQITPSKVRIVTQLSWMFYTSFGFEREIVGLGCRFKANCLLVGPEPIGDVSSVGGERGTD